MKLFLRLSIVCIVAVLASCVKNEPFLQAYSVPSTYNFENKDSSATARLIMMYGLKNYLASGSNAQLDATTVDSLWNNDGSYFTKKMVPDFLYDEVVLNKMSLVTLASATGDADSTIAFADSMVANSQFYNVAAGNGIPGTSTVSQPVSVKKLFSKDGIVFDEVWFNTMLGAMAMRNALAQLKATGTTAPQAWNLAYGYTGLPVDYDPSVNYDAEPLRKNRPLGIAAYFATAAKNIGAGPEIYEEFRRGRSAIGAGDARISSISLNIIRLNIERTLAAAAVNFIDDAKEYTDVPSKLNALSKAYGLVIALENRALPDLLPSEDYWQIRDVFKDRFYTLVQDASYTKINTARSLLAAAYAL